MNRNLYFHFLIVIFILILFTDCNTTTIEGEEFIFLWAAQIIPFKFEGPDLGRYLFWAAFDIPIFYYL
jgi:hypothetical protein